MGHAFCLPVLIAVTLLVSFNPFVGGAGLFPWGLQHGDIAAWDSDDSGARETIDLVRPVQFNGVMYDQITIDTGGNLNFDDNYETTNEFPTDVLDNVIAAFWDYLVCQFGYYREAVNEPFIQDAGLHVRQTFGLQEFEPTWAFITTWRNCHHEDFTDAPLYEDYNFQAVLLQDDSNVSYALFMYDKMNGRHNVMSATIGVQALDGDNRTFVELCHGALGDIVHGRKQSQCQTMPGMRAFRTDVITSMPCINALDDSDGCSEDDDCTDSNCLLCDTRSRNCVECVECDVDADCPDLRPVCAADGCCKCTNDSSCPGYCPVCNADGSCEVRGCSDGRKALSVVNACANTNVKLQVRRHFDTSAKGRLPVHVNHPNIKPGRQGGACFFGRCFGKDLACNRRTNTCEYPGMQRKLHLTCHKRKRQ